MRRLRISEPAFKSVVALDGFVFDYVPYNLPSFKCNQILSLAFLLAKVLQANFSGKE
jgi:hypothetical protein